MTPSPSSPATDTTRPITFIILAAYVFLLFAFTVIAYVQGDSKSEWFELSRTGFTTLGSALTLILGYYFGKTQVAEEAKREGIKVGESVVKEVEREKAGLQAALEHTATPRQPDSLARVVPFQTGKPSGDGETKKAQFINPAEASTNPPVPETKSKE